MIRKRKIVIKIKDNIDDRMPINAKSPEYSVAIKNKQQSLSVS